MSNQEKDHKNPEGFLGAISYVGAFLEKFRIAQRMKNGACPQREIEYITGLTEYQIDLATEEGGQAIADFEREVEKKFWNSDLTQLLLKVGERKDDDHSARDSCRKIFEDTMEKAKRETRLHMAYKMLLLDLRIHSFAFFGGTAHITNLSIEDMECLADIRRIRVQQEKSTQARVVKCALEEQIDRPTIAKIVGVDLAKLDDLLTEKYPEEDAIDFSLFMFKKHQALTDNHQLPTG